MIHFRKFIILAFLLLLPTISASASEWQINMQESSITFHATQLGIPFKGTFNKFTGTIHHDPSDLSKTTIALDIYLANALTGNRQRDNTLPTPEWFDSLNTPIATFKSTALKAIDGNNHTLEGSFKLKQTEKSLSIPLTLEVDVDGIAHAVGEFRLNRLDFSVGLGEWADPEWIGINVVVKFNIKAKKK